MRLETFALGFGSLGVIVPSAAIYTQLPPPLYGGLDHWKCPPPQLYEFFSRPDLKTAVLSIKKNNNPAPGYVFLTPTGMFGSMPEKKAFDFGPHIFDNDGELVWSGVAHVNNTGLRVTNNFHVCHFEGQPHLCFAHFEGNITVNDIFNDSYERVRAVVLANRTNGDPVLPDGHEFRLVPASKTPALSNKITDDLVLPTAAIVTALYKTEIEETILSSCNNTHITWVKSFLFQEISLDGLNTVLFEWDALDHVPVSETIVCPFEELQAPTTRENGEEFPFDYIHINSIDKDGDGNYVVCGRHTSAIYKIDGRTGDIIWRLGGRNSSFVHASNVLGSDLDFNYQHHIRFDDKTPGADGISKIGLSIWNNDNNLRDLSHRKSNASSALSILVDEDSMIAWLQDKWISPDHHVDSSQGSHQVLPNGNHLLGMGNVPYLAEYDQSHNLVFYANLGDTNVYSYRAFRFEWEGRPKDPPSLFAYAPSCHGDVKFYVSWNGATEVKYWSFFVGFSPDAKEMREVVSNLKTGFETVASGGAGTHAYAVAYNEKREPIGRSEIVQVFIPAYEIYNVCSEDNCGFGFDYAGAPTKACFSQTSPDEHQIFLHEAENAADATEFTNKQFNQLELELDSPIRPWWKI